MRELVALPAQARGKTYTTGGQVTGHPLPVAITLLLVAEHLLELVTEGKVQGLGREVTDDVGSVATPQGHDTLLLSGSAEALDDTVVLAVKTTDLKHLILLIMPVSEVLIGSSITLRPRGTSMGRWRLDGDDTARRISYLVLDQKLDTLNGSGGSLRDGGGNTTHCYRVSTLLFHSSKLLSALPRA
jgi:hypothetical protein